MADTAPLRLYGQRSDKPLLDWAWVDNQLAVAGTYWVTARSPGHPHPRPVWGVWRSATLYLSLGTPITTRTLAADPVITVRRDSGTDVVIVEGHRAGSVTDPDVLADHDRKYDWTYDLGRYGPLTSVAPETVLAWRTAGWAGRESFQETGRWHFA